MQVASPSPSPSPGVIERWAGGIASVSLTLSSALLVGMFLLINIEIGFRYLLGTSTLIADEYAGYMFAALVYLGLNHAIFTEKLIAIELPARWNHLALHPATRLFIASCVLTLNAALLYASMLTLLSNIRFQSRSIHYSETLFAIPQSVVVAGLILACLASVALMARALRQRQQQE